VLQSCLECLEAGRPIELHIAAKIHPSCEPMLMNVRGTRLEQALTIHGRVQHETFLSLLSEMDLCISLRYPTMGETSAVVMRALQAGTPVIVSDIGWYSELPEFLPKIEPNRPEEQQELTNVIMRLSDRGREYEDLFRSTQEWVAQTLQFDDAVDEYVQFMQAC
jgi:hypothetical protein